MTDNQKSALGRIAQAAVFSETAGGCPAELSAAQCILESGWLMHSPGNNCFGIKIYAGCFGRQLLSTAEWFTDAERDKFLILGDGRTALPNWAGAPRPDGRIRYAVKDWFATFATLGDCFTRHATLIGNGRPYAAAFAQYAKDHDSIALARGVAHIYATDPSYAERVVSLMQSADVIAALSAARADHNLDHA